MAINKEFYATINELTNRSVVGEVTEPVNASTWIDYGRQMSSLDGETLSNGFLKNLLNRIKVTVDTFRTYKGKFLGVYRDTSNFGNIQMFMKHFYESRQAPFIGLKSGDSFPFKVYMPDEDVTYYTDGVAKQLPITIQSIELRGAFESPERMDSFIAHIFGNVANSLELQREVARRNLVVNGIREVVTKRNISRGTPTSLGEPVQVYNLGKMYVEFKGLDESEVPANQSDWLSNPDFVRYAVSVIQAAGVAMKEVSTGFNKQGVKTFSDKTHIVTCQPFKSAVTLTAMNTFHDNYLTDGLDGEVVAWWEDSSKPMNITLNGGAGEDADTYLQDKNYAQNAFENNNIIAVMYDEFTFGEFVDLESTTSQYNGEVDATNYYYNDARKYVFNPYAPLCVFTLGYGA